MTGKSIMNEHQPSMTEWLAMIGEAEKSAEFRREDNAKDDRLEILYQTIELPYERPTNFPAVELKENSGSFKEWFAEHADELCALRLVPTDHTLPKLRNRGLSVRSVYEGWFQKQDIDPKKYTASFRPHAGVYPWSMIFVIRPEGIFGEMIPGQHAQLTHGDTETQVSRFSYNFSEWQWQHRLDDAGEVIQRAIDHLHVPDTKKQHTLEEQLVATFAHDYLIGYYEAILWPDDVVRFSDYNRVLVEYFTVPNLDVAHKDSHLIVAQGATAYPGVVTGVARLISPENLSTAIFNDGDILVTGNTDVRFVPLMKKAGAIVTGRGGVLSHASIVARELKKPCVVGVGVLKIEEGQQVTVDADQGTVFS